MLSSENFFFFTSSITIIFMLFCISSDTRIVRSGPLIANSPSTPGFTSSVLRRTLKSVLSDSAPTALA